MSTHPKTTPTRYAAALYPSLVDATVLITGGATGIGATLVRHFVAQGSRVAFIDINVAAGAQLVEECAVLGSRPLFESCDVTDIAALPAKLASLEGMLGSVRVLINNAANDQRHTVAEVTPTMWRQTLAVNLDHQFFCTQALAPGMARSGGGSIVNMGSCSWRLGMGGMPAYVTAKAAIEGLTNGLARDLGPSGIRVNCIVPGFIKTERQVKKWLTPEMKATILQGQCLKTLIEPEEVAHLAAFLASEDARMCTSQTYAVDAGWI